MIYFLFLLSVLTTYDYIIIMNTSRVYLKPWQSEATIFYIILPAQKSPVEMEISMYLSL